MIATGGALHANIRSAISRVIDSALESICGRQRARYVAEMNTALTQEFLASLE